MITISQLGVGLCLTEAGYIGLSEITEMVICLLLVLNEQGLSEMSTMTYQEDSVQLITDP